MERIDAKVKNLYDKIPINCRDAFLSTLILGLVAHVYMFTNKLPNYDDMALNGFGATFRLGRWFLWVLGAVSYHLGLCYSLPLINGLISITLLAVSSAFIVKLLGIDSKIGGIVVSAILVVFPSWTATFFFMFTAPYYAVAVLLMVLAVYIDFNHNKVISVALIACSLGIYQAYLPFGASLYLTVLLLKLLKNDCDVKKVFKKALSSLVTLLLGIIVYYIIMKISLVVTGQQLADYKGINDVGNFSLSMIPSVLKRMIRDGLGVAFNNNLEISYGSLIKFGYLFLYFTDIVMVGISIVGFFRNREFKKVGLLILFSVTFLVAVNSIFIMCPDEGAIYSLMTYSYTFLVILPVCLVEKIIDNNVLGLKRVCEWFEYGIITVSIIMVLAFCHFANAQYLSISLGFEQTLSYYTSVITQIKSTDGYQDDMAVAFVHSEGNSISDATMYRNDVMRAFDISGRDDVFQEVYSIEYFLKYYCGFSPEFVENYDEYQDLIDDMPVYPMNGSIKIVDNLVIVKLS